MHAAARKGVVMSSFTANPFPSVPWRPVFPLCNPPQADDQYAQYADGRSRYSLPAKVEIQDDNVGQEAIKAADVFGVAGWETLVSADAFDIRKRLRGPWPVDQRLRKPSSTASRRTAHQCCSDVD